MADDSESLQSNTPRRHAVDSLSIREIDLMIEHFEKQISSLQKRKEALILNLGKSDVNSFYFSGDASPRSVGRFSRIDAKFCRLITVDVIEIIITLTIVTGCVVAFWRGIWELSDYYLSLEHIFESKRDQIVYSGWTTFAFGICLSFLAQFGSVLASRFGIHKTLTRVFEKDTEMKMVREHYNSERESDGEMKDVVTSSDMSSDILETSTTVGLFLGICNNPRSDD